MALPLRPGRVLQTDLCQDTGLRLAVHPLVHDRQLLDADVVAICLEAGPADLGRPGVGKVPDGHGLVVAAEHSDGGGGAAALQVALYYQIAPLPDLQVLGDAAL